MTSQRNFFRRLAVPMAALAMVASVTSVSAREPFTAAELKEQQDKLTASVKRGYDMWYGARADMAANGLACANCHPDAAATNPQTFPKYLPMFDKVVPYREMVNWCIQNPQAGQAMDVNDPDMTALEAYSFYLHKGVKIETGLVNRQTAGAEPKNARGFAVKGTGIGFDK
jgi:thiosulfate dehydrogenase